MAQWKLSPKKTQAEYISDDDTSEDEVDPQLKTTPEERQYGTIPGSAQVTQAALSHTRVQTNPVVECSPPKQTRRRIQQPNTSPTEQHNEDTNKNKK